MLTDKEIEEDVVKYLKQEAYKRAHFKSLKIVDKKWQKC